MNPKRANNPQKWQFWIDRGGTFTDIVARQPDGRLSTHKLLSENPQHYPDAAVQGIRDMLELSSDAPLPTDMLSVIKMGTTVATNALLERTGADTLLVITSGFKDALRIGYQNRPRLFDLEIKLPKMLYRDVLEVEERLNAHGNVLTALNIDKTREELEKHYQAGLRSVAIVLMHGYRFHQHEKRLAKLAHTIGFTQVSVSHETSPLMKLVLRGDTTVVDAYLSPVIRDYVNQVAKLTGNLNNQQGRLMFMQSSGGLTDANFFQGKDAILSGPAGGVIGMARVCESAGIKKVIGFDMGGTSTDVSHYNGEFEKTFESHVAGVRLRAPMMLIHTVAAGGGSILNFDGARFRVGPASAGAQPGPACYRNHGPLTITDCNVMLGKLQPEHFPKVFGPGANQGLDKDIVITRFNELAQQIEKQSGITWQPEAIAEGFLTVAIENMANAIKKISVQRGYDVSEYTLCCFGGAGGQHACRVADALDMKQILVHPYAGVLSAYGMGLADVIVNRQQSVEAELDTQLLPQLGKVLDTLQGDGLKEMELHGEDCTRLKIKRYLHCRYQGSDTALSVDEGSLNTIREQFEVAQQMRFGFTSPDKLIIVEFVEIEILSAPIASSINSVYPDKNYSEQEKTVHDCYLDGEWRATCFYPRGFVMVNTSVNGPAVILDDHSTIIIEPGWRATSDAAGNLLLERYIKKERQLAIGTKVDPVRLEIFNNLFMSIAEQMGTVLANTAVSVNIKERLDFSCAIFDKTGSLVANAPHVPVHLGSMGESVKSVIREHEREMHPGDAWILNAPYNGGTHLPDITIIKPVFNNRGEVIYYVATRGHHADIGGKSPGSAPADSTMIEEEGILIDNVKLVDKGRFLEDEIYKLLTSTALPARNPGLNIADFKAQLAACEKGARELSRITGYYGNDTVQAYMQHVRDNAEASVRNIMTLLNDGSFAYKMDDGSQICVDIKIHKKERSAVIDFTGSSPQHPGNLNAPSSVVRAAVLYVMRCMVEDDIPLNDGCLIPVKIIIPKHSMINPQYPAAVFAGNVETSQYLVDALFGALGVMAASQGTMNNFIWGNNKYQYYETLCGGTGAGKDFHGADAVHSHMTNSRLTDPEVLEWRFPVILQSFEIKKGSGGQGRYRGGDGVIRKVKFLEAVTANIISGHRQVPPYGLAGGEPGKVGVNRIVHIDKSVTELSGNAHVELKPGDVFVIETPGGGGFGKLET